MSEAIARSAIGVGWSRALLAVASAVIVACSASCLRQAEGRTQKDLSVGRATSADLTLEVDGGLARIRQLDPGQITLWAQSPDVTVRAGVGPEAGGEWLIVVENALPDAVMRVTMGGQQELATVVPQARPTVRGFRVTLEANVDAELRIAPPDADVLEPWRVAVMGDIQTALGEVDEVFATINQDPSLRMVLSTGDIVENGRISEYDQFAEQLETLDIPYYSTIGNHELIGDIAIWLERFGRFNVHFTFKGATFSLVDSGSATIDPLVYDWLDGWLEDAKSRTHVFLTHFPPIDPVGLRAGSFRSRKEASKLLRRLADGNVDLTLYGHIHSYYEFDNAGIPAFVSGGGGALPERFDNIGRHFLALDVTPDGITSVTRIDVD